MEDVTNKTLLPNWCVATFLNTLKLMDRVLGEIIVYGKQENVKECLPQHIDGCIQKTAEELQCNIAKKYNGKVAKTAIKRYNVTLLPTLLFSKREISKKEGR